MHAPDAPATDKQRGWLATHGERERANDPALTVAAAANLIDQMKGSRTPPPAKAAPAVPVAPPALPERQATTVERAPEGAGERPGPLFVQIAAWIPIDRLTLVTDAIREARAGVA